jgi:hypothetical protein
LSGAPFLRYGPSKVVVGWVVAKIQTNLVFRCLKFRATLYKKHEIGHLRILTSNELSTAHNLKEIFKINNVIIPIYNHAICVAVSPVHSTMPHSAKKYLNKPTSPTGVIPKRQQSRHSI